jgi:tripeptide aminopeptidase
MITLQPTEHRALLERFLRYVQVDTQSDESSPSHPSTDKQKNLARHAGG